MTDQTYHSRQQSGEKGAPLVFAFHGTGGDENQFFFLAQQLLPNATIIAPRGDVSEHGAARFFRRTGEGVYDMDDLEKRTEKMASFIRAHKSQDPSAPIYGFGYSNGANILASVSIEYPEMFDRIALLHPLIPWEPGPIAYPEGAKVLITAGRMDPICPLPKTEALIEWYINNGANVETRLHEGGHELRQVEVDALATFLTDQAAD